MILTQIQVFYLTLLVMKLIPCCHEDKDLDVFKDTNARNVARERVCGALQW